MKKQEYKDYLQHTEKLSEKTITEHLLNMQRFYTWAISQQYQVIEHLNYTEILHYIQHEKQKNLKVQTIKLRLNSIKKYYEYLKHIGIIDKNPCRKINLKGQLKTITQNVLQYTELEQLYNEYIKLPAQTSHYKQTLHIKQRNNVLLGLMIWQGIGSGDIEKLNIEHINLEQGTIYIPKIKRSASRELKLYPAQIIQLYKYIDQTRPQLIKESYSPVWIAAANKGALIPGCASNQIHLILQELRGINQKINNASQIRASVIIHWIKVYGKRKAQYMAGHKHISSTERFELQEMDTLTDALLKHHPFGRSSLGEGEPFSRSSLSEGEPFS